MGAISASMPYLANAQMMSHMAFALPFRSRIMWFIGCVLWLKPNSQLVPISMRGRERPPTCVRGNCGYWGMGIPPIV